MDGLQALCVYNLAPPNPLRPPTRTHNTSSFLRYLFPRTHGIAQNRLFNFRYETLPYYRRRAQYRIYEAILAHQKRKRERHAKGQGLIPFLRRRRSKIRGFLTGENVGGRNMSNTDPPGSVTGGYWGESRERGARRRKLYGYLKAANEMRQSYQEQWAQSRNAYGDDEQGIPGAFPDVEVVRNGDEEMVLFPSYARQHVRKRPEHRDYPGAHEDLVHPDDSGDAEYWKREWEKYEDDNAIVDVDVRGWLYVPHRGPLTRKNRLLIAVARRLSGIPAPPISPSSSRPSSRHSTHRERYDDASSLHEEETANKEVQKIIQKGESEARAALQGGYSEEPSHETKDDSPYSSRSSTPDPGHGRLRKALTDTSLTSDVDDTMSITSKRSWVPPEQMSRDELRIANEHLLGRLRPFMTLPLTNTPITVFFFNEDKSQSRTVYTNDSGHFTVRASLDFVPTNVRVLASENLSATEEVRIIEPKGISLVSDIDDTIKHSAISSGAKEIFRNTFIRNLGDLTIGGIKEWYAKLYSMGVNFHYVSNSPWQLYPLLRSFFGLAGLPPGSFHLKAYTGMLQGIFEPAAERKRGSLERIFHDFPERKFILIGDSGEADLEVYTDTVLENPGRVLAIFIRDVTTPEDRRRIEPRRQQTFDSSTTKRGSDAASSRMKAADESEDRPSLHTRPTQSSSSSVKESPSQEVGNLIDLDEDGSGQVSQASHSSASDLAQLDGPRKKPPPKRPSKPLALRSDHNQSTEYPRSSSQASSDQSGPVSKKGAPPPPPKPRRSTQQQQQSSDLSARPTAGRAPFSSSSAPSRNTNDRPQPSGILNPGFAATASRHINAAYNALPSVPRGYLSQNSNNTASSSTSSTDNLSSPSSSSSSKPPAPPPRRALSSYPAAAAQYASNRLSWNETNSSSNNPNPNPQQPLLSRKEEMWQRRWARAEDMLKRQNVVLRTWRVGDDVMDESLKIVEREFKKMEKSGNARDGR